MDNESIPHDDPRFVEILEACLHMEIAGHKESYTKIQSEIRKIKRNVLMKLEKRKELKKKIEDAEDLISMLNVTLKKLQEHVRETEERINLIEANADDRSKLMSYEKQYYHDILQKYEDSWQSYHARYEEFPLAKRRKEMQINVKKAHIEKMELEFRIKDMAKKIEKTKEIDYIRTKSKIVEFVKLITNSEKLERRLTDVVSEIDFFKQKLRSRESELKLLREQEEEERKARAMQLLEMPPPKINLSRVRLNYSREWQELQFKKQIPEIDTDSLSVNTIALEEMCIRDETSEGTSKKQTTRNKSFTPTIQNDRERATSVSSQIEERETHTLKNTETCIETTPLQKNIYSKKELSFTNKPEAIMMERILKERDMHKRTTMQMHEEEKYDRNQFGNDGFELKRMKKSLGIEKKDADNIQFELSQHSSKSARVKDNPVPRITKIEKVQYGIAPLTKHPNVPDSSKSFMLQNFEQSGSRATSFTLNDALMIKELNASRSLQPSMYNDNSSHFKFSECANVSNIGDMDINMDSVDVECQKVDRKENEKETSPKVTPRFNFSDLLKLKADNFRLF